MDTRQLKYTSITAVDYPWARMDMVIWRLKNINGKNLDRKMKSAWLNLKGKAVCSAEIDIID